MGVERWVAGRAETHASLVLAVETGARRDVIR